MRKPYHTSLELVSWCLTSLFSTNIWLYQGRKVGWRAIPTQYRKASGINLNPGRLFIQQPLKKGKGLRGSFKLLHQHRNRERISHYKTRINLTTAQISIHP